MELLGTSLAGCALISMRTLAQRDENLDLATTTVEVDISVTEESVMRTNGIRPLFHTPQCFSKRDWVRLQRAAEACTIKHSCHADTELSAQCPYPET